MSKSAWFKKTQNLIASNYSSTSCNIYTKNLFIRQIIYELFQVVMLRDLSCILENRHGCVPFFFFLLQTEQFTVLWLLFAMIVVGNIAVLIGLQWGKRRKTRMDFFIKQLAFAGKFFFVSVFRGLLPEKSINSDRSGSEIWIRRKRRKRVFTR